MGGAGGYEGFGPLPDEPPPPAASVPPLPSLPTSPRPKRNYVKRALAWFALALSLLLVVPAVAASRDKLRVTRTPVPGMVVDARPYRVDRRFDRCELTVEFPEHGRRRTYRAELEQDCRALRQPGEAITVYVPDTGEDDDIVIEGMESHDKVGAYIGSVVVPLCPLLVIGLPALRYLRRERRERKAEEQRGALVA